MTKFLTENYYAIMVGLGILNFLYTIIKDIYMSGQK